MTRDISTEAIFYLCFLKEINQTICYDFLNSLFKVTFNAQPGVSFE